MSPQPDQRRRWWRLRRRLTRRDRTRPRPSPPPSLAILPPTPHREPKPPPPPSPPHTTTPPPPAAHTHPHAPAPPDPTSDSDDDYYSVDSDWGERVPAAPLPARPTSPRGAHHRPRLSARRSLRLSFLMSDSDLNNESNHFWEIIRAWRRLRMGGPHGREINAGDFVSGLRANLLVIDALGTPFRIIKRDTEAHCALIDAACRKHNVDTIQEMIRAEGGRGPGTEAVLWMKRSLQFVYIMLSEVLNGRDMPGSGDVAYKETLYDCHPIWLRNIAKAIRVVAPTKAVFCARIDPDADKVMRAMKNFLWTLRPKLEVLVEHCNDVGAEKVDCCKRLPWQAVKS